MSDGGHDNDELTEDSPDTVDCNTDNVSCDTYFNKTQQTHDDDEDQWSEDVVEIPAGVTDTILTAPDFVTDNERQCILNIARGEGNRPISIFRDKYSEELAYPGIFLGQKRPDNTSRLTDVHYSEISKSEWQKEGQTEGQQCVLKISFSKQRNCK